MSKDGDGYVTFKEFREIADKLVVEAEARAEKEHREIRRIITENRDSVQRLQGAYENHLAERAVHDTTTATETTTFRVEMERRVSKLEANQYVQVALLVITIIASVIGLFKLFIH